MRDDGDGPRPIAWIKAAKKDFLNFPKDPQREIGYALGLAAIGDKAENAKLMKGLGSGIIEIALPFEGDAYRTIYALTLGKRIWVLHAFQKKSKRGIKTPKPEIDKIQGRIKQVKELVRNERRRKI